MKIVFDIGSGTSLPSKEACRDVVDAVAAQRLVPGKEVALKAQLFTDIPPNEPLPLERFRYLMDYAHERDIECSASVFDLQSLGALVALGPRFIKVACRPDLYHLAGLVPRGIPLYVSYDVRTKASPPPEFPWKVDASLACVPEYPADLADYQHASRFGSISDHTVGLGLFREFRGDIFEKHLCLERSPDNPDSGPFALCIADGDLDDVFNPPRPDTR